MLTMKKFNFYPFLLVPLVFIVIEYFFIKGMFPIYSAPPGFDADPAYQYLFNGLLILQKMAPVHIDHPGTTLQSIISVLILIKWTSLYLFQHINDGIVVSVGRNPESYLKFISLSILSLNSWSIFYLGTRLYQSTQNKYLSILGQITAVLYGVTISKAAYPAPDAIILFASITLLALISPKFFNRDQNLKEDIFSSPLFIGAICGFGLATKLTFLPMLLLIFLFNSPKKIFITFVYTFLSWLFFIFPIIKKTKQLFNWAFNLLTHSGHYGTGANEFFDFSTVLPRFNELFSSFPLVYIVLLFLFISLFFVFYVKNNNLNLSVPFILIFIVLIQTVLVIKHPGPHYMISVLCLTSIGLVWSLHLFNTLTSHLIFQRIFLFSAFALVLSLGTYSVRSSYLQLRDGRIEIDASMKTIQTELSRFNNPVIIAPYSCTLIDCALSFGLGYATGTDKILNSLFPNFYTFNIWGNSLFRFGQDWVSTDVIQSDLNNGRDVFLVTRHAFPQLDVFTYTPVFISNSQSLYRITGLSK